ncbi:propionyl-CoA synthetase, partial [Listeria monocytogenes]|nr:propionyl-CoA synthetase [Listeria monocytogenes]
RSLAWYQAPANILASLPDGTHRWFADGRLTSAYLALDRQIEEGRGEQTARIYDSPVTGTQDRYSYLRRRDEVARLAGALHRP